MADENQEETTAEATPGDRLRKWARWAVLILMIFLMFGDIALYSLYQAQRSHVEALDHRVERLDNMLDNMLAAQGNAERIERVEQRVDVLGNRVGDLKKVLEEEAKAPPPTKKKRR